MKPDKLRKDLEGIERCKPIRCKSVTNGYEFQIELEIVNPDWGMPSDFETFVKVTGAKIVDFSHIREDSITVYVEFPQ